MNRIVKFVFVKSYIAIIHVAVVLLVVRLGPTSSLTQLEEIRQPRRAPFVDYI